MRSQQSQLAYVKVVLTVSFSFLLLAALRSGLRLFSSFVFVHFITVRRLKLSKKWRRNLIAIETAKPRRHLRSLSFATFKFKLSRPLYFRLRSHFTQSRIFTLMCFCLTTSSLHLRFIFELKT